LVNLQFSWRHLTFAALFGAAAAAALACSVPRMRMLVLVAGVIMAMQVAIPWSDIALRRVSPHLHDRIGWLLPQFGGPLDPGMANPAEYVPAAAAVAGMHDRPRRLAALSSQAPVEIVASPHRYDVRFASPPTAPASIPLFLWPAFACVGCELGSDGQGLVTMSLPPGASAASIIVARTPGERIGRSIMAGGLVLYLLSLLGALLRRQPLAEAVPLR
jgi:hypothetical protein